MSRPIGRNWKLDDRRTKKMCEVHDTDWDGWRSNGGPWTFYCYNKAVASIRLAKEPPFPKLASIIKPWDHIFRVCRRHKREFLDKPDTHYKLVKMIQK
ncbi:MAG: hypothetical protein E6L03_10500 [Thaumarchaeota archaeon]|nr:MAG: hypothetical protein E6L03_10500 [Nitrososphaerota archaeon]